MSRLLILLLLLTGCASLPQNDNEAREWFHSSSFVTPKEYDVSGVSLKSGTNRLETFAEKCLLKKLTHTSVNEYGGRHTYSTYLKPRLLRSQNSATLLVLRDVHEINFIGVPKEGRYDFVVELTPAGNGVHVFSSRVPNIGDFQLGNVLEDLETWLRGEGKFCPEVS